jgi:DNA-binding transcriptional regulator YiaG
MDYSKAIKELRERMMLSQEEFAEKLGVSFATVNRWENGHHEPTYKARRKIVALCKKHGIPTEMLQRRAYCD